MINKVHQEYRYSYEQRSRDADSSPNNGDSSETDLRDLTKEEPEAFKMSCFSMLRASSAQPEVI